MVHSSSFVQVFTLMAALLCSCQINRISGDGHVVSKEIPVEEYDEIQIMGENIDLRYSQSGDAPYLKIETDQNIMDLLEIDIEERELTIRPKNKYTGIHPTRFVVTARSAELKAFKMAGGGVCDLGNGLSGKELHIELAGGGTIKADSVSLSRLDCETAGSATVFLSGKTEKMTVESAGSSEIKALGLETEELDCDAAGSTDIEITVHKTLNVKIAGSGTIRYKGNPDIKEKRIAGSGSLIKVD